MKPFVNRLTPRYGIPVVLSLLIHGLIVGALAAVPFELKDMTEPPTIAVALVEPASSPAEPSPAQAAPPLRIQPVRKPVPSPIKPVTAAPADVPDSVPSPDEPTLSSAEVLVPPSLSAKVMPPPVSRPLPSMAGPERESLLKDPTGKSISISQARAREGATPAPEYPLVAREAGWEGTVVLQVEVLPDGTAGAVTVYRSSGYPVLDQSAVKAVKAWRFVPAMDGNFPIRSSVRIPVKFDLKSS